MDLRFHLAPLFIMNFILKAIEFIVQKYLLETGLKHLPLLCSLNAMLVHCFPRLLCQWKTMLCQVKQS